MVDSVDSTASEVSSCFPVTFQDGKNVVLDPRDEKYEDHIPSIDHLKENKDISEENLRRMQNIIFDNKTLFARNKNDLGCTHLLQHEIDLVPGSEPCREGIRRMSPEKLRQSSEQIEEGSD